MDAFSMKNEYFYIDDCLMNGLYTFAGYDAFGDGWGAGAGYTLTGSESQQGELVNAMNLDPKSIAKLDKLMGRILSGRWRTCWERSSMRL
jgi:hypothetical protein